MKKLTSILLTAAMLVLCLTAFTACSDQTDEYKVGVIQFMSHDSLDDCYEGIKNALEQASFPSASTVRSARVTVPSPTATPSRATWSPPTTI